MRLLLLLLLLPALSSTSAAEAVLRGRYSVETADVTVPAGGEATLTLTWIVELTDTTCTREVDVGIDFIPLPEDAAEWVGAEFDPDAAQTKTPSGTGTTALFVFVDPDASVGAQTTLPVTVDLNAFNAAGACSPVPREQDDTTNVVVHVGPRASTATSATDASPSSSPGKGGSPGFESFLVAIAVAFVFLLRR